MDINTIVLIIILGVLLYAMVNNSQEKRLNFEITIIKRKIICEAAATAMLANLKLRKQKS